MRNVLIDAGPLVALFAVDDRHHKRVDAQMAALAKDGMRLLTTWPCVVEAAYLLDPPWRFELLRWIVLGGVQVYPFESHHLGDMIAWMWRYTGSCPFAWCKSRCSNTISGRVQPDRQGAVAANLTMALSLKGAMVSSVI